MIMIFDVYYNDENTKIVNTNTSVNIAMLIIDEFH